MIIEVIAINAEDAAAAAAGGANRIELVTGIAEGGLTPSLGLIEAAVRAAGAVPVQVMIRPHSQSFCYSEADIAVMTRDIMLVKETGASGVVFGALTVDGDVDLHGVEILIAAAEGLDITFHRAFDEASDLLRAYEVLKGYPQIRRILTSGGQSSAKAGAGIIRKLSGGDGPRLMGGSGLRIDNVLSFVRDTNVQEVHFGSGVRYEQSFLKGIDPRAIAAVRKILD